MKYKNVLILLLLNIMLVGCSNNIGSNNLDVILDDAFKYKGTWMDIMRLKI